MKFTLDIPDEVAQRLAASERDLSRRALEGLALEGYRTHALSLYQVGELLGLSRIEAEDFLGRHQVAQADITEADLNREAAVFEAAAHQDHPPR